MHVQVVEPDLRQQRADEPGDPALDRVVAGERTRHDDAEQHEPFDALILATGAAKEVPVAEDGKVVTRRMMKINATFDHRVIDGAEGVRFTTLLSGLLGDIRKLLL